jgi:hypothetical protein
MRHFSRNRTVGGMPAAARRVGVVRPRGGQIQVEGQRPRAAVGDQRARHRDLAIADLAERAAVLPLHADGRLRALLGEAGVVDREDARADRDDRAQLRPDALRRPTANA